MAQESVEAQSSAIECAAETARHSYDAVRGEILLRMRLRDHVLLFYLASVGTILSVAFGVPTSLEMLLTIPFIALGASIIVSQHNSVMALLGQFCAGELEKFLKEKKAYAPHWDNSETYSQNARASTWLRTFSHVFIILTPCILSLWVNRQHALNSDFPFVHIWLFSFACFLGSIVVIYLSHKKRETIYDSRSWPMKLKVEEDGSDG